MAHAAEELMARDEQAINYARGELKEGDTLVYIDYPNNQLIVDADGFPVKNVHKVHSSLLLAAFLDFGQLFDDTRQLSARRKKGFGPGKLPLPPGVFYVIDLTPPDVDDAALELTAELSCSNGILHWFTAVKRLDVSRQMAGGKEETIGTQQMFDVRTLYSPTVAEARPPTIVTAGFEPLGPLVPASDELLDSTPAQNQDEGGQLNHALNESDNDADFKRALKESKDMADRARERDRKDADKSLAETNLLDYSPIRHRVGIERLLKVIESKDPRLDSAPKVWTLAVLAKYFGCTRSVSVCELSEVLSSGSSINCALQGHIFTWFIAEPNCQIIEVLPEATLRVGMMIENYELTRAAYAILVSEEAINCGSQLFLKPEFYNPMLRLGTAANNKKFTRLGRIREAMVLDEDTVNLIQHAGQAFATRIEWVVKDLLDLKMAWLQCVPELDKLRHFSQWLQVNLGITEKHYMIQNINKLTKDVSDYVKGCLFACIIKPLDFTQSQRANEHRAAENWDRRESVEFNHTYNRLTDYERVMTRFFWEHLNNIQWDIDQRTNTIHDDYYGNQRLLDQHSSFGDILGIPEITMISLENGRNEFNAAVTKMIQKHNYLSGVLPQEAYKEPRFSPEIQTESVSASLGHLNVKFEPAPHNDTSLAWENLDKTIRELNKSAGSGDYLHVSDLTDAERKDLLSPSAGPGSSSLSRQHDPVDAAWDQNLMDLTGGPASRRSFSEYRPKTPEWMKSDNSMRDMKAAQKGPDLRATLEHIEGALQKSKEINPTGPLDEKIPDGSPYFSLTRLLREVQHHVRSVTGKMIRRGECATFGSDISDHITCLSDSEFKFLPLWAGGLNDGTGGVFEEQVPATFRSGFKGPGPSYHTGSTVNSVASSEDFDMLSDAGTVDARSSLVVDDGRSSYMDQRMVYSDDGFGEDEFEVVFRPKVEVVMKDVKDDAVVTGDLIFDEDSDGMATPRAGSEVDDTDDLDLGDPDDDLDLYNAD